ncbi:MAG: maleylpyruvate isomerase N-terminal domain-containing protein [Acidimicrobiia bacterium]|nr:maleylpyruvate isomerase N-terminal domain-containing protein [Acidimicrobiia bacterium]
MPSRVPAAEVLALFNEGVDAFCAEAARLDDAGWARLACGEWTATQLARHVLSVIGWYHDWLNRAEAGDASPAFPIEELDQHTARSLEQIGDMAGPDATERFRERAVLYAGRLVDHWNLPYGYPRGTVTAGLHAGVAAVEWHAHTWDLARSNGRDHVPSRPDRLFLAAADCQAAVAGGLKGAALDKLAPLGARREPWRELLKRLGRA